MLKTKSMVNILHISNILQKIFYYLAKEYIYFLFWIFTKWQHYPVISWDMKIIWPFIKKDWFLWIMIYAHYTIEFRSIRSRVKLTWDFYMDSVCYNVNWGLLLFFTWKQSFWPMVSKCPQVSFRKKIKQQKLWSGKKYLWRTWVIISPLPFPKLFFLLCLSATTYFWIFGSRIELFIKEMKKNTWMVME